jgi:hypothetical protein
MKIPFVFFIIWPLLLTACSGAPTPPPPTQTPIPILTPTATDTPTPQPTAIRTPTSTPAAVEDDWQLADPVGEPLSEWKGIPVMPQVLAGEEGDSTYYYILDESALDVYNYYMEEMPVWGWKLFALGEQREEGMTIVKPENTDLEQYHPAPFFMGGAGASSGVFFLIHPDTGRVYVMLTYN